ncbi:MAG: urease accessory protein UreE [Ferruginibacter sp.]|nr:urease accessory protein UreE [Ferruginibacter sp.]
MLIQQKIGHIQSFDINNRHIDYLMLDWHECHKRILRKKTNGGIEVLFKSLNADPNLSEGDVLYQNEESIIVISITIVEALVIIPKSSFELASLCYEIGNKHLALFYENDTLLIPFEMPLFRQLSAQGYDVRKEERKLLQQLKTTVQGHSHQESSSLFSKILKLTANE